MKCDLVSEKFGYLKVMYEVNCFDRGLEIVFNKNVPMSDKEIIEDELNNNYMKWHDIDTWECCEEYMINNLSEKYKDNIVAVLYEYPEEDEYLFEESE